MTTLAAISASEGALLWNLVSFCVGEERGFAQRVLAFVVVFSLVLLCVCYCVFVVVGCVCSCVCLW